MQPRCDLGRRRRGARQAPRRQGARSDCATLPCILFPPSCKRRKAPHGLSFVGGWTVPQSTKAAQMLRRVRVSPKVRRWACLTSMT
eukprot:2842488-Lingulodinium_polyedra.AAC.1